MFSLRKLVTAAALATVALFGAPGQGVQAATELGVIQSSSIGEDYTSYVVAVGPNSVAIGPAFYTFAFTPITGNALLTAAFEYNPFSIPRQAAGTFTGGFVSWSDGDTTVTQALVAGTRTTLEIPLAAAGPDQTLIVGFDKQSGFGVLVGTVSVTAIPLPASGLLLLAGLGATVLVRRRVKKLAA